MIEDFDFSDCELTTDTVTSIQDLAAEVLQEYAPDHGNTRIERLARWVVFNLSPDLQDEGVDEPYVSVTSDVFVHRDANKVLLCYDIELRPDQARELATALLICAAED